MLNSLSLHASACAGRSGNNSVNARPMYWLCVVQSVWSSGSPPVAFARTDHVGRPLARRHSLTLIVFPFRPPAALVVTHAAGQRQEPVDGLCVLARTI